MSWNHSRIYTILLFSALWFHATIETMFFFMVCTLITVLLLTGHTPDQYGWMMLTGISWLAGYLDCRKFANSDRDQDRVMPPDAYEPMPNDQQTFEA